MSHVAPLVEAVLENAAFERRCKEAFAERGFALVYEKAHESKDRRIALFSEIGADRYWTLSFQVPLDVRDFKEAIFHALVYHLEIWRLRREP